MHCSILGFVGFTLAKIKPPWSEAHHLKMWPLTHLCSPGIIVLMPSPLVLGFQPDAGCLTMASRWVRLGWVRLKRMFVLRHELRPRNVAQVAAGAGQAQGGIAAPQ